MPYPSFCEVGRIFAIAQSPRLKNLHASLSFFPPHNLEWMASRLQWTENWGMRPGGCHSFCSFSSTLTALAAAAWRSVRPSDPSRPSDGQIRAWRGQFSQPCFRRGCRNAVANHLPGAEPAHSCALSLVRFSSFRSCKHNRVLSFCSLRNPTPDFAHHTHLKGILPTSIHPRFVLQNNTTYQTIAIQKLSE